MDYVGNGDSLVLMGARPPLLFYKEEIDIVQNLALYLSKQSGFRGKGVLGVVGAVAAFRKRTLFSPRLAVAWVPVP